MDPTPYLSDPKKCPNLSKYLTPKTLEMMKTKDSQQIIGYPNAIAIDLSNPAFAKKYQDDYVQNKTWATGFTVGEDVLTKLGYKFTPIADIEASMKKNNRRLTYNDIKITPEIKTVADFEKFLNDAKNLNLTTKAGDPVIPLGGYDPTLILGATYGFQFSRYSNRNPSLWFGAPNTKLMLQTFNKWVRSGLRAMTP